MRPFITVGDETALNGSVQNRREAIVMCDRQKTTSRNPTATGRKTAACALAATLTLALLGGCNRAAPKTPRVADPQATSATSPPTPQAALPPSPLDGLDPAKILAEARADWQPNELIAVLGTPLGRHHGSIGCMVFSPRANLLATAGLADDGVCVWEVPSLRLVACLPRDVVSARSMAFSPDGKTLATGDWGGRVQLWDLSVKPMRHLLGLAGHTKAVTGMVFLRDGNSLVTSGRDELRLWNVRPEKTDDRLRATFQGHQAEETALALSPDGKHLASVGSDGALRLWNLEDRPDHRKKADVEVLVPRVITAVVFLNDRALATADKDCTVRLWSLDQDKLTEHAGPPTAKANVFNPVAFSPNGALFAVSDGDVTLFATTPGGDRLPVNLPWLPTAGEPASLAAFSPDNRLLATAHKNRIHLWALRGKSLDQIWELPKGARMLESCTPAQSFSASTAAFTADGKALAVGGDDGTVRVWDLVGDQPRERLRLDGLTSTVTSVAASPTGDAVAAGCRDGTVRLWDLSGGRVRDCGNVAQHDKESASVAFSHDGQLLATAGYRESVIVWDFRDGTLRDRARFNGPRFSITSRAALAFSPDNKVLAVGGWETVELWELNANGARRSATLDGRKLDVTSLAFSPDGQTLAAAESDAVKLWDLTAIPLARPRGELKGHAGDVTSLRFARNGEQILSVSRAPLLGLNSAMLISMTVNDQQVKEHPLSRTVKMATLTPDGRHFATVNGNGTVYILRMKH